MGLPPWITMPADPTRGIKQRRGISAAELNWGMLFAFGRPYLSDLFNFEPMPLSCDGVFEAFQLESARRDVSTTLVEGPCLPTSVQRDVHQELRGYSELLELSVILILIVDKFYSEPGRLNSSY